MSDVTRLHEAVRRGDVAALRGLLSNARPMRACCRASATGC